MKAALVDLYTALKTKAGVTPVEENVGKGRIQLLARLAPEKTANWRVVVHRLKKAEFNAAWGVDVSKVFFCKNNNPNNPLVHGWRIIIKSSDLETSLRELAKLINAAPNARVEVDEIPLPGGGRHRQFDTSKGKGASVTSGSRGSGPALHLIGR